MLYIFSVNIAIPKRGTVGGIFTVCIAVPLARDRSGTCCGEYYSVSV